MAKQLPLEKGPPIPDPVVQQIQSMLQQAQAAAAAQIDPARPTRQEALLQHTDLVTPGAAEDDMPPPAYGDSYGEIPNEQNGLGTDAHVVDDGRVIIHINQFSRYLSQLLTPALRQHVQSDQGSRSPPLPYISPCLGGEEGVPPTPPLNVVIQVVDSRGDVQTFVASEKILKNTYGHCVRPATHRNFNHFLQENGLEFFSIGSDPSLLTALRVKNPGLLVSRGILGGDVRQRRRDVVEYI